MKALVTGSAGFIGRHMAAELSARGWAVYSSDIATGGNCLDLRAPGNTDGARLYDLVVHAAAQAPHRAAIDAQPASHIRNQMLDASMFDWAIRTRQRRLLYFSSCAALDERPDDYGALKLAGERMARQARRAGVAVTVVRPYSGYGEGQGVDWPFGAFVDRARRHADPFEVWNPHAVRDWIHVDDIVAGALAVVESGTEDPVSLCTGIGTSMRDLIRMLTETAGYRPALAYQRDKPAGVAMRIGDPATLLRYYTPRVSLADGVKRAMQ